MTVLPLTTTARIPGGRGAKTGIAGPAALAAAAAAGPGGGSAWAPPAAASDAELLAVELLQAGLPVRVVTELPVEIENHLPIVQVVETPGGGQIVPAHDTAVIDYDGYAATRATAKQIAAQCRQILLGAAGHMSADGQMWVNRVVEMRRPTLLYYDDASDIRRFGGSVRLNIRYR